MHRRMPPLIAALFVLGMVSWGLARAQSPCDSVGCVYLPLIRSQVLPTNTPTVTPVPTAIPITPTVHVRSSRIFPASYGTALYVVGEVENGTNKPAYFVKVIAKFYDGTGAFVATENTYTYLDRTAPGQRNPFRIILSNAPAGIVRADFTLTWSSTSFLVNAPATIISDNTRDNNGVEIFGEVRNDQTKTLKGIELTATFYDGAGNVYDVDLTFADISTLAPGAVSTYSISTFTPDLTGLPYALQAQGNF